VAEKRVAVLVPNLFLRAPIDMAIAGAGAVPVTLTGPDDPAVAECAAVVADLGALGDDPGSVARLVRRGAPVLAFGPHVEADALAAARRDGAMVLPRGAFLARLPELLADALGAGR
jgi:hypothetical protein